MQYKGFTISSVLSTVLGMYHFKVNEHTSLVCWAEPELAIEEAKALIDIDAGMFR